MVTEWNLKPGANGLGGGRFLCEAAKHQSGLSGPAQVGGGVLSDGGVPHSGHRL